jgi:hypothetical protein
MPGLVCEAAVAVPVQEAVRRTGAVDAANRFAWLVLAVWRTASW